MSLLQNSNAISSGSYDINNSLRLRSSASAYLSRTMSASGTTATFSFWVKRGTLGVEQSIFLWSNGSTTSYGIEFNANDTLTFLSYSSAFVLNLTPTQVFRDPSAWYHIVCVQDTTQATAANRAKIYVNGTQVTAFSTATYPAQNTSLNIASSNAYNIGRSGGTGSLPFDGYFAEWNFIDGQALTPSSFGETDATTGVWKPKAYSGTYGTNGFYLPFRLNSSSGFSSYYGSFNGTTQSLSATLPSTLSGQFTIEGFIRPNVVAFNPLFTLGDSSASTGLEFYFGGGSTPSIFSNNSFQIEGSYNIPATIWAHIAVTRDASNVIRLFINGTQVGGTWTSTAAFSNTLRIGAEFYSGSITGRMNGFISNFRVVTGSALYTSTFTPPSSALTAVSGTQLLTLQNSTIIDNSINALTITNTGSVATTSATVGNYISDVGYDYSGNRNTWTTNNINYTSSGTTYDAMTDSPTLTSATVANYCVMNPLNKLSAATTSNGNLNVQTSGSSGATINGTFGVSSGKWYWETILNAATDATIFGIDEITELPSYPGVSSTSYSYYPVSALKINNAVQTSYGVTATTNDVIGCALDMDNGKIWWSKNGTWMASGDPVAGTNAAFTGITGTKTPAVGDGSSGSNVNVEYNFGQRPFSYTPPTGFNRLNTFNLPTSTIVKGNTVMDATLYTGNGASRTVTNTAGFKTDLVWVKSRSNGATWHILADSVRGAGYQLSSNRTEAEIYDAQGVGFASNGFTLGADTIDAYYGWNLNGDTYVGWQWQAGQGSTSSNTNGSITSTVSVNTTAGFSIVTYTGTGALGTVGHGLGVAPSMLIIKSRSAIDTWRVYHASLGNTKYINLNDTSAAGTASTVWNNTSPTSSVFTINTESSVNGSGRTQVAYCWAEIAGFSKFGSYTGNGSADGPMIFTGFKPKFVMFKRTDTTSGWYIHDSTRNTSNVVNLRLLPNTSDAEATVTTLDFLSNGFKLRTSDVDRNASGGTYIYACFASNPFKNSNAV